MNTRQSFKSRVLQRCALIIMALLAIVIWRPSCALSSDENVTQITDARELLSKWVDVRKAVAEDRRHWTEGKEFLNNRIQLVQQEIESLKQKIADLKSNITETDTKRAELEKENEKLGQASESLKGVISKLEIRTKQLLAQMPAHVGDKVRVFSQQLPEDPDKSDQSVIKRIQPVLGILSTMNKYSRDINVASEIRNLPDGRSAEVAVIYLGLARAYYVSANGQLAGTGGSDGTHWVWAADNTIAPQVAQTIAVFKNEQPAAFVQLPVASK